MGAAAAVELADEPLMVPNFSCRRRTSRGGLATEFTNAILTWRPADATRTFKTPTLETRNLRLLRFNEEPAATPTFWLVGVGGGDVLREHPQALLALVVQPQVHLPPRLVLLRRLALKVPLTVAHPQLVRLLREPLERRRRR